MRVSTMRRVDEWVGMPLCLLATGLRWIFRWLGRAAAPEAKPQFILVVKLSELGAVIILGPAMRVLGGYVPREQIYFLTFEDSRSLMQVMDYVPRENILGVRTDSLWHLVWDICRWIGFARRKRMDTCLDLEFFSRASALIAWLSGCRRRVGVHAFFGEGPYRGDLLTHRVKFNPHIHVSQMFETLAKAVECAPWGFPRIEFIPSPVEQPRERFKPTVAEAANVDRVLAEAGTGGRDTLVLLNSNISDRETIPLRKWADENYVQLAKMILDGIPDVFVLLTGSPKEAETVQRLEASVGSPRCRSVAGKTTLRELLTLYSKSDLLVTNDSGPAHFATVTDIDVVVMFGPETPLLWLPLGPHVTVVYRGVACSPCFTVYNGRQSACRDNVCMNISPAEVFKIIRHRLADRQPVVAK